MDYISTNNGVPSVSHFYIAMCFAVGFGVARFFLDRHVFRKLAIWLQRNGPTAQKLDEARALKIAKCSESMWKLVYYTSVEVYMLMLLHNEPWFSEIKECFRDLPNQELRPSMILMYMCECGFYLYSITALLTWETRRKDFSVMMSHHIVTVILISYSYMTRFFRIGSIIIALHDASDVFLEAAKVFKYSEKEFGASFCFGLFAVSWIVLRLIYFPFWVIRASSYDSAEFLNLTDYKPLYYVFNTMLLTLLVFHFYWWLLIYSMIMKQLKNRGKVGEDIRSDSEDEDN